MKHVHYDMPKIKSETFRCSPPSHALKNFSIAQLEGTWYIVRGLNPDYDCFDCAISTYSPTPNSQNYTLSARYDVVMLNGSVRQRLAVQQTEQKRPSDGGLLDNTQSEMGLTMYEKWYVLGKDYFIHLLLQPSQVSRGNGNHFQQIIVYGGPTECYHSVVNVKDNCKRCWR